MSSCGGCGHCGDCCGAFCGELCFYRTADKRLDVLWFRCDGPVRMTDVAVRLLDETSSHTITDILVEPDAGRISLLVRAEDLIPFEDRCVLEVLGANEHGERTLLVQAPVAIRESETTLASPGVTTRDPELDRLYAQLASYAAERTRAQPLGELVGAGMTTGSRRNGNGNGNGNGHPMEL